MTDEIQVTEELQTYYERTFKKIITDVTCKYKSLFSLQEVALTHKILDLQRIWR